MKVSIVTPSFNREGFLRKNLESVRTQEYQNLEHIVIDGGSSDGTLAILKEYEGSYALKFVSRQDKGMYYAINDGIKMSSGDIVAYLNTDDFYFPWSVRRVVDEFTSDPNLDMVYGDSLVQDISHDQEYLNIYADHRRFWLKYGGILCQPTVFLNRRVFEKVGYFNTEYKYLADCDFWQRINQAGLKIKKLDEVLAIESNHQGALREKQRDLVSVEKLSLDPTGNGGLLGRIQRALYQAIAYLEKELKILRFAWEGSMPNRSGKWDHFLSAYQIRFHAGNHILCKLCHDRLKYPRFILTRKNIS